MYLLYLTVFLITFIIIIIYLLFPLKDKFLSTTNILPGAPCTLEGGDKNGEYYINYNLQCSLGSCKAGYMPDSTLTKCVPNTSPIPGDLCVGPDVNNSIYSYKSDANGNLVCTISGCNDGYNLTPVSGGGNACVFKPGTFCRFGTDPNGFYLYDETSKCVLNSCNKGYIPDSTNTKCISKYPSLIK